MASGIWESIKPVSNAVSNIQTSSSCVRYWKDNDFSGDITPGDQFIFACIVGDVFHSDNGGFQVLPISGKYMYRVEIYTCTGAPIPGLAIFSDETDQTYVENQSGGTWPLFPSGEPTIPSTVFFEDTVLYADDINLLPNIINNSTPFMFATTIGGGGYAVSQAFGNWRLDTIKTTVEVDSSIVESETWDYLPGGHINSFIEWIAATPPGFDTGGDTSMDIQAKYADLNLGAGSYSTPSSFGDGCDNLAVTTGTLTVQNTFEVFGTSTIDPTATINLTATGSLPGFAISTSDAGTNNTITGNVKPTGLSVNKI